MFSEDSEKSVWQKIASDLGLTYEGPSITGIWQAHEVEIELLKETRSGHTNFSTGFEVKNHHDFNTSFQLARQGLMQNFADLVGSTDIQVGEPVFDKNVLVKGWSAEVIQFLFQFDRVRQACLAILTDQRYDDVRISHAGIMACVPGKVMTSSQMEAILRRLLNVNLLLKEADISFDQPTGNEEPVIGEIPSSEVPQHEVEEIVDEVVEDEPEQTIEPKKEPHTPVAGDLSCEEIVEALSGTNSDIAKQFEESFKNKEVDWKLEPLHIIPGLDDSVFGTGSGWIATFAPGKGLNVKYRIGQQRKDAFDLQPGTEMDIQGQLVGYDPSSAMLYIDSNDPGETEDTHSATILVHY